MIVDNLNMRDSGWKVGECIEAEEKTINYNHIFCSEALPTIADTFKTEYEIDPAIKTIHLRKVEYNKGEPFLLEVVRIHKVVSDILVDTNAGILFLNV